MKSWLAFAWFAMSISCLCGVSVAADEPPRIPACMIVDDPTPFVNPRWVKDKTVCPEIPTSFYQEFGRWAESHGVKGKFSVVPCIGGIKDHTFGKKTAEDILADADKYITADGAGGTFVAQIKKGTCLVFYTHIQTLYGNGTKSGMKVFEIAVDRLRQHFGDRIQWMTGVEICRHFCPPPK